MSGQTRRRTAPLTKPDLARQAQSYRQLLVRALNTGALPHWLSQAIRQELIS